MKIKNNSVTINLPSPELKLSEFYSEKPFIIFYNDNFIEPDIYDHFILKMKYLFNDQKWSEDATGKKRFKFDVNRRKIKGLDEMISDFVGIFGTKEFKGWFKQTHECFYNKGIFGSVFPKYKIEKLILKIINKISRKIFKLKAFNVYTAQVEFSKLPSGASLVPHTDSYTKRMALVFYTPFTKTTREMTKKWGTTFWKAKTGQMPIRSWLSNHQLNNQELKNFFNKNEVLKSIDYKSNRVNGFIKNDLSWHSVEKNTLNEDRVAVVINIHDIASTEDDIPMIESIQSKLINKSS